MGEHDEDAMQFEQANTEAIAEKPLFETSGDVATKLVDSMVAGDISPEQDRECLRRIDLFLLPVMFLSFSLQYLDKACLTGAALFGILEDLKLLQLTSAGKTVVADTTRYSYCTLIFYWGFLAGLLPGVILVHRFPVGRYVAILMFLWGGIAVCTVAVQSYEGLLAQRFFLGFTEAGLSPAFSLMTAMFYKRQEQPLRFAFWFSASGIGVLLGSLLFYAIGHLQGSLSPWRYQFMIIGSASSVWGICLWFLLPDSPITAYFLSKDMRVVAVERMRYEQIGIENKTIKWDQVKETFIDPKTYFFVLMTFAVNLTNGALSGFGSVIVQSFGYSTFETILLLGVAGVFVFVFALVSGTIAIFIPNTRTLCAMFCCLPVVAGAAMIWRSDWQNDKAVPLWGFFIMAVFSATFLMVISLMAANTAGHTKKSVTASLVWGAYCVSNGIAPLLVKTQEQTNHYPSAFITIFSMMSFTFVLLGLFRAYVFYMNKRRDAVRNVDRTEAAMTAFLDLTDRKNQNFRYLA